MNSQKTVVEDFGTTLCSSFLGTLKPGAIVFQDFCNFEFHKFYDTNPVFRFERLGGREELVGTADGFGSFAANEKYGNGKIYVLEQYVVGVPFVSHGDGI